MLDNYIIDEIKKRERGWEPEPLYLPLYEPAPFPGERQGDGGGRVVIPIIPDEKKDDSWIEVIELSSCYHSS